MFYFILILFCFSCKFTDNVETSTEREPAKENSDVIARMFVPDYQLLAGDKGARAITPDSDTIILSLHDGNDWNILETLSLADAEKEEITAGDVVGYLYTIRFKKVPSDVISYKTLRLQILSGDRVTAVGYNETNLSSMATEFSFFAVPIVEDTESNFIPKNEMCFKTVEIPAKTRFSVTISASTSYPDLVIFNEDGTYRQYISVDKDNPVVEIEPYYLAQKTYLGFWAVEDDVEDFDYEVTLGKSHSEFAYGYGEGRFFEDWKVTNPEKITLVKGFGYKEDSEEYGLRFDLNDFVDGETKIASLLNIHNFDRDCILTFYYKTSFDRTTDCEKGFKVGKSDECHAGKVDQWYKISIKKSAGSEQISILSYIWKTFDKITDNYLYLSPIERTNKPCL